MRGGQESKANSEKANDFFCMLYIFNFLGPAAEYARLVRVLEGDPKSRPIRDLPDDVREELSHMHVVFHDSAPLTIVSHESLADLNSRLKEIATWEEVPMNRFRMNIEVKGCSKAYYEDDWFLVEIGGVSFMVYDVDEVCVLRAFGHLYSCSLFGQCVQGGQESKANSGKANDFLHVVYFWHSLYSHSYRIYLEYLWFTYAGSFFNEIIIMML